MTIAKVVAWLRLDLSYRMTYHLEKDLGLGTDRALLTVRTTLCERNAASELQKCASSKQLYKIVFDAIDRCWYYGPYSIPFSDLNEDSIAELQLKILGKRPGFCSPPQQAKKHCVEDIRQETNKMPTI